MNEVRIPRQPRSKKTRDRVTKAAFKLFAKKGIHSVSINEIVKNAGVATGSFYAYFKNKRQLLLELLEDFLNNTYMLIWKDLKFSNVSNLTKQNIKTIVMQVFNAYDISPQFMSQAFALRYTDPEINRVFGRERQREIAQIMSLMESNNDRIDIEDTYAAAVIIHNTVEHVAHTAKLTGGEIEEHRLLDELSSLIFKYLSKGSD